MRPGDKIIIPRARLAFESIYEPESYRDSDYKAFKATLLLDKVKEAETINMLSNTVKEVKNAVWPQGVRGLGICLKDGDALDPEDNTQKLYDYDGHANHMFIRCLNQKRPQLYDRSMDVVSSSNPEIEDGDYVKARIQIYASKQHKKICAKLQILQLIEKGKPFEGQVVEAGDDFEPINAQVPDLNSI